MNQKAVPVCAFASR